MSRKSPMRFSLNSGAAATPARPPAQEWNVLLLRAGSAFGQQSEAGMDHRFESSKSMDLRHTTAAPTKKANSFSWFGTLQCDESGTAPVAGSQMAQPTYLGPKYRPFHS